MPTDRERKKARHREYMREVWYPKNKSKHKALVKVTRKKRSEEIRKATSKMKTRCIMCGESRPEVLDFHHRDPDTKEFCVSPAISAGWSLERIIREIEKCDVLCANCHRVHHHKMRTMKRSTSGK